MVGKDEIDYESKNEVQRIVAEISEVGITIENYKTYLDKIKNTERVIVAQLENYIRGYKELNIKMVERLETETYKQAIAQGFVPKDIHELQLDIDTVLKDSYSWKSLANELNKVFFNKITIVLEEINALDIKKGTLEEMREMETRRNESQLAQISRVADMVEQIVNHKLQMMDDKIISTVRFIEQEARNEKQAMMNTFLEALSVGKDEKARLLDMLKADTSSIKGPSDVVKQSILSPVPVASARPVASAPVVESVAVVKDDPFNDDGSLPPIDDDDDILDDDG